MKKTAKPKRDSKPKRPKKPSDPWRPSQSKVRKLNLGFHPICNRPDWDFRDLASYIKARREPPGGIEHLTPNTLPHTPTSTS